MQATEVREDMSCIHLPRESSDKLNPEEWVGRSGCVECKVDIGCKLGGYAGCVEAVVVFQRVGFVVQTGRG